MHKVRRLHLRLPREVQRDNPKGEEEGGPVHLKIDDVEVDVPAGTTVKEAAMQSGIRIPGLCDYPGLKP